MAAPDSVVQRTPHMTRAVLAESLSWRPAVAWLVTVFTLATCCSTPLAAQNSTTKEPARLSNATTSAPASSSQGSQAQAIDDSGPEAKEQTSQLKDAGGSSSKPLPFEVKPDVLLLRDKDGHLQTVPGFTLEDFTKLYNLKVGLA